MAVSTWGLPMGQVDEHEILPADFAAFQPAVYASGQIVQLGIGDALCMRIVKQNRRPGSSRYSAAASR